MQLLRRELRGQEPLLSATYGFSFDPAYGEFLQVVARRTPRDATVAVLVPRWPDVYRYQAVYLLAPRRVVDDSEIREAGWIAVWKTKNDLEAAGERIGEGRLLAR